MKSGGEDGHWKPAASDKAPSITVVNGTRYVLSEIALYTSSGKYSFVIEGAGRPQRQLEDGGRGEERFAEKGGRGERHRRKGERELPLLQNQFQKYEQC